MNGPVQPPVPRAGVVVVAAGRGERLGGALPKQFQPLGGRPLFWHCLARFARMPFVGELVLVLPRAGLSAEIERLVDGALAVLPAPVRRVAGGARRQDSVAAGLQALLDAGAPAGAVSPNTVALVHDAARPFPDAGAVERLVREAARLGGGLLARPCTDTVKLACEPLAFEAPTGESGDSPFAPPLVARTLDRTQIWLAQTPQAIRADLWQRAIADLRDPALAVTDEAALLERWGVPVALVASGPENFKVTQPGDLARAEAWLALQAATPAEH